MNRRLILSVLLALLALAALPAAASAAWFPARAPVDGPSPDIEKLGGVDLARDGTGGVVYLKRVDGAPHVFLSRFNGGQFRPPERVDNGIGAGASDAAIAAADVDRLAIVWTAGNRVYGSARDRQRPAARPAARPDRALQRPRRRGHRPRDRHGHQRHRLRHVGGAGRRRLRRPRRAPVGHRRGRPSARRWTSTRPRRRARHPALARRRLGRGQRGRRLGRGPRRRPRARLRAARDRARPVRVPAGALAPRPRRRQAGGRGRLGRHRHRGRRLVRVGRLPPGLRRRLARRSRGGCSARPSTRPCRSTAGRARPNAADRHQRPRPGPRDARGRRRRARRLQLQRHLRARRSRCTSRRRRAPRRSRPPPSTAR